MAAGIDLSDREKINQFNELKRRDTREHHINKLIICGFYLVAGCCAAMFVILVLQYILPAQARFLDAEATSRLQTFLFSGTIRGVLTGVGNRLIRNPEGR